MAEYRSNALEEQSRRASLHHPRTRGDVAPAHGRQGLEKASRQQFRDDPPGDRVGGAV